MRLIFLGATELGYQCCDLIIKKQLAKVVAIFTIPQDFRISYSDKPVHNVLYKDFDTLGKRYSIPVIEVTKKMSDYKEEIRKFNPDFLLAVGWYYMIPKSIRNQSSLGCAGIHASLLPKYRGGAPLVWAVINGESRTGVSFFHFEDGIDNGDIIAQQSFSIEENYTIRDLLKKTRNASLDIIEEYIPKIANGTAPRMKQDESKATYVPQRKPEDGLIDWYWDSKRIKDFIRAQTKPYPGAFTLVEGKKVTIWDADIENM